METPATTQSDFQNKIPLLQEEVLSTPAESGNAHTFTQESSNDPSDSLSPNILVSLIEFCDISQLVSILEERPTSQQQTDLANKFYPFLNSHVKSFFSSESFDMYNLSNCVLDGSVTKSETYTELVSLYTLPAFEPLGPADPDDSSNNALLCFIDAAVRTLQLHVSALSKSLCISFLTRICVEANSRLSPNPNSSAKLSTFFSTVISAGDVLDFVLSTTSKFLDNHFNDFLLSAQYIAMCAPCVSYFTISGFKKFIDDVKESLELVLDQIRRERRRWRRKSAGEAEEEWKERLC